MDRQQLDQAWPSVNMHKLLRQLQNPQECQKILDALDGPFLNPLFNSPPPNSPPASAPASSPTPRSSSSPSPPTQE